MIPTSLVHSPYDTKHSGWRFSPWLSRQHQKECSYEKPDEAVGDAPKTSNARLTYDDVDERASGGPGGDPSDAGTAWGHAELWWHRARAAPAIDNPVGCHRADQ